MAKNESSKSKAELYREERKARISQSSKKNSKNGDKINTAASIAKKAVAILLVVAIVAGIGYFGLYQQGAFNRFINVLSINGEKVKLPEYNYYYTSAVNEVDYYAEMYAQAGYSYGPDKSISPDEQTTKDADGKEITWAEEYAEMAVEKAQYVYAVYTEAVKAGYKLTDDEIKEIDETIAEYEKTAKENNFSLNAYLKAIFGAGFTAKSFREQLEVEAVMQRYLTDKEKEYKDAVTSEVAKEVYEKDKDAYDRVDILYYGLNVETLTKEEAETDDEFKARQEALDNAALKAAQAALADVTDAESFKTAVNAYVAAEKKADAEKADYVKANDRASFSEAKSFTGENGVKWIYDDARKAGDFTVVKGTGFVYFIYLVTPAYVTNSTSVRHCLVEFEIADEKSTTPTDKEKKAAYDEAKALLDEWLEGDKSESSFATMAKEYSTDTGSKDNGGLYETVRAGDMVDEFEAWCFDEARKPGDTGIVETTYGYHIMYFVSDNEKDVDWEANIKDTKGSEDYSQHVSDIVGKEEYKTFRNEFMIEKVSADYCKNFKKNQALNNYYQ